MYGRYTKELGNFAKEEAVKLHKKRKEEILQSEELAVKYQGKCASKFARVFGFIWKHSFAKLGEDWVFLALLGLIMAFLSFIMDHGISMCNSGNGFLIIFLYKFYSEKNLVPFNDGILEAKIPLFICNHNH